MTREVHGIVRRRHRPAPAVHQLAQVGLVSAFALVQISDAFVARSPYVRYGGIDRADSSSRSGTYIQRDRSSTLIDASGRLCASAAPNGDEKDDDDTSYSADEQKIDPQQEQRQQQAAAASKGRAMAALSNPGGLSSSSVDNDLSGGDDGDDVVKASYMTASKNYNKESDAATAEPSSILPPLPDYDNDFKKKGGSRDMSSRKSGGIGSDNGTSRRRRRPHVKMKRRTGQGRGNGGANHKPSSFSSSVSTPSSLLPPPPSSNYKGDNASHDDDWDGLFDWEREGRGGKDRKGTSSSEGGKVSGDRSGSRNRGGNGRGSSSFLPSLSGNDESPMDWGDWFEGGDDNNAVGDQDDNTMSSPPSSSSFSLLPDLPPIPGSSWEGGDGGSQPRPLSSTDLPSVSDLFAPSASPASSSQRRQKRGGGGTGWNDQNVDRASSPTAEPTPVGGALEGVIPVSELFYRSTQSISAEDDDDDDLSSPIDRQRHHSPDDDTHDDEELPFSIEQSDKLTTDGNKIRIRRNQAGAAQKKGAMSSRGRRSDRRGRRGSPTSAGRGRGKQQKQRKGRRKMVRRGMEMLVGGEPVNADPPLRCVELHYNRESASSEDNGANDPSASTESMVVNDIVSDESLTGVVAAASVDWASLITLNSRDFGPLLHNPSASQVSDLSRGLYCEHFVNSALKWKICPKDFRDIVKVYELSAQQKQRQQQMDRNEKKQIESSTTGATGGVADLRLSEVAYDNLLSNVETKDTPSSNSTTDADTHLSSSDDQESSLKANDNEISGDTSAEVNDDEINADNSVKEENISLPSSSSEEDDDGKDSSSVTSKAKSQTKKGRQRGKSRGFGSGEGFGSSSQSRSKKNDPKHMSPPSSFHAVQSVHEENTSTESSDGTAVNRAARRKKAASGGSKDQGSGFMHVILGGELKFTIGVSRSELESGHDGGSGGHILRRVLSKGIASAIKADDWGLDVRIAKLILSEIDGGSTDVQVEFHMIARPGYGEAVERKENQINAALAQVMDDGDMAVAMAAAAKLEKAWPSKVRDRVVEEFLFEEEEEEDDDDEESEEVDDEEQTADCIVKDKSHNGGSDDSDPSAKDHENKKEDEYDGPFGMPGDTIYAKDDIFLGGGNGGVFYDYSESGEAKSPFKGELGPLLVDAATQRAIQRLPRVIAIGDVHGCLDELQMLLRRCDYQPGDLVVFLGDLVSKGPDSLSVVQMAREIGAIGVRGNHDFEVIRWHQAMKSGADPPVIGSEHFHIASGLSKADLKWMYSLPWYISSKELGALFVHAGFVSGIRLNKQNPRLMMNMRSILPDGTVTSKFFNNWPWARLWDGPQTVLFGHDADRGLQQYEHAIGLDTGCVYGGRLTACILPEKRLVSVSAKREYFQYRRKHFD